jgi:hypothetical protein
MENMDSFRMGESIIPPVNCQLKKKIHNKNKKPRKPLKKKLVGKKYAG